MAWYCDVRPLSSLGRLEVASVEASPALQEDAANARRLLRSTTRRRLAVPGCKASYANIESNAMDNDACTAYVTVAAVGAKYKVTLKQSNTKVQSVKLTNAKTNAERFTAYRVLVDSTVCGTTKAAAPQAATPTAAGEEVVVTCGEAPNYVTGSTVTIETTTKTNLQLAEVSIVGNDPDNALKNNVGNSCNK